MRNRLRICCAAAVDCVGQKRSQGTGKHPLEWHKPVRKLSIAIHLQHCGCIENKCHHSQKNDPLSRTPMRYDMCKERSTYENCNGKRAAAKITTETCGSEKFAVGTQRVAVSQSSYRAKLKIEHLWIEDGLCAEDQPKAYCRRKQESEIPLDPELPLF